MEITNNIFKSIGHLQDEGAKGSNQMRLGQYNERLVLSLIREGDGATKADLARMTRLTPQTISVIVNRLLRNGFLKKGKIKRGNVGKPSTVFQIDPSGAFSIGVQIGRRSMDVVMMSFDGRICKHETVQYEYPRFTYVIDEAGRLLTNLLSSLSPYVFQRITGVGIAAPGSLEEWESVIGAPKKSMSDWKNVNIADELRRFTKLPIYLLNDVSASCLSELTLGKHNETKNFIYLYIGTLIGGGLVIGGQLFCGMTGNAGAVGSMPSSVSGNGSPPQLIELASLWKLEKEFSKHNISVDKLYSSEPLSGKSLTLFNTWSSEAANAIAFSILSGVSFLDVDSVIIDSTLPNSYLEDMISKVKGSMKNYNIVGLSPPKLSSGSIGSQARVLGGAFLPLYANFSPDREIFMKLLEPAN